MARDADCPNCKKYGVPFYGVSWVPPSAIGSDPPIPTPEGEAHRRHGDDVPSADASPPPENYLVFSGGGGEGRSGIPNALLLASFDFASNSLSDQPVSKLRTGADLPYRMAIHPGGDGIICSLPKSCRWFEWDPVKGTDVQKLGLKSSDIVLDKLEDIGQQLALTFNNEGSVLALGGEDGKLRVFKWPSMEIILDEVNVHASVKDLDFSPDGKFLVSVGSSGPGRVWDVTSSTPVASLSKENDEMFGFCRFSRSNDKNPVLYITAMRGQGGSIVKWNTSLWKRVSSKHIIQDPISAFNVSADGKLLAIGTIQGDVLIINSSSMHVQNMVRKAHLGLVTALMISQDSRALVSASLDSSARVTLIKDDKKNGLNLWIIILIILLAMAVYYVKAEGIFP
ncbi:SEC12-like protein 2 isoform X1 [Camellia sinensis]|uniref:SEC12-like protein 2 isoform X1 n=1 Tax=Camellia sinensis TaxID=4442 RepID=UPI0010360060|nr:SEC12-like protein 2 isoform X1 [Camellia sinensis]